MTEVRVERMRSPVRLPWWLRFRLWRHCRQFDRSLRKAGLSPLTLQQALDRAFFFGSDPAAEWARRREAELRARAYALYRHREAGKAFRRAMRSFSEAMQAFNQGMAGE